MSNRTELITIERKTVTRRPGAGVSEAWTEAAQMWARADWIGGGEGEARGAVRATTRYRFTVLSAAAEEIALAPTDRVLWNGERYNIREVPRRLPNRIEMEIIAESGVGETQS